MAVQPVNRTRMGRQVEPCKSARHLCIKLQGNSYDFLKCLSFLRDKDSSRESHAELNWRRENNWISKL